MIAQTVTDRTIDGARESLDDPSEGRLHFEHLLVEHGMNEGLGLGEALGKYRMAPFRKHHNILLIEPLDQVVPQDLGSDRVDCLISVVVKNLHPVGKELRIDMAGSRRSRNGGRKQNARSHRNKIAD